jgi:AraC family transcriptional regulator
MKQDPPANVLARDDFLGTLYMRSAAGGFSLGQWVVDRWGDEVRPHGHKNAHFVLVTGGRYTTTATGEPACGRLQLVYNPPNTFHRDRFESQQGSFFTLSISAELLDVAGDAALPRTPTQIAGTVPYAIAGKLMRACALGQPGSVSVVEALCFEMLGSLATLPIDRRAPGWLSRACDLLRDAYAEEIAITTLSRTVGVHPIHLTRTFRAFYGCTPGEFLRARRVQKAAEMLLSTRLSLVEVALKCGFADQSHLTRHFRRAFGVPPGQYRRLTSRRGARE